jgi:hypothetical protein
MKEKGSQTSWEFSLGCCLMNRSSNRASVERLDQFTGVLAPPVLQLIILQHWRFYHLPVSRRPIPSGVILTQLLWLPARRLLFTPAKMRII